MPYIKTPTGYSLVPNEPNTEGPGDKQVEKFSIAVNDQDRQAAAKDQFTTRLFKDRAAEMYAAGLRPSVGKGNNVLYMPVNDNFKLPDGSRLAVRHNKDNDFDIIKVNQSGEEQQLDDQSAGMYRGLTPDKVIGFISEMYTKRYNDIHKDVAKK